MTTLRIKEHLNVLEIVLPGVCPCCVGFSPDPLRFEKMEEALGYCIVPKGQVLVAVASAAYWG